ncbi:hypothetical protein CORC01_12378 [Colletotrichum orchidophilum]|uniref:Amidoligase enzyme n=1 Tax=Colletotrichum orchidophilum TaxID=1209926 RepID=A0A1G4AT90_9PEZI|nr:uncharacterized protein CORC01_12378 [Colletotrichum orchidophilum]OHE92316.1 hypothetical protein CORC01_12378 [Colletotrichum orchidophilum]
MGERQTQTTPPRVSFGVELEFFVAFIREGEADPDNAIKHELQPLVVVPPDDETNEHGGPPMAYSWDEDWVFHSIGDALAEAGLPVYSQGKCGVPGSVQNMQSGTAIDAFQLKLDISLKADHVDGYRWQRVEMISPAMHNMKLSFDMIRLAVSVITTNFRCRVNPSCGFHVHVGVGPTQRIDARTLRHFAALLWAADPLISRLHAPWRSALGYSQSARVNDVTSLGEGRGPADVIIDKGDSLEKLKKAKFMGRDRWLGDSVDVDANPEAMNHEMTLDQENDEALLQGYEPWQHRQTIPEVRDPKTSEVGPTSPFGFPPFAYKAPVPMPRNYRSSTPNGAVPPRPRPPPINRRYARVPGTMRRDMRGDPGFLEGYILGQGGDIECPELNRPARWDVMSGVRDLLGADITVAQVGQLMTPAFLPKHINYKFRAYDLFTVGLLGLHDEETTRTMWPTKERTIEFREAAGSLDVEWIATWARICCRLLEWSRDAAPAEFMCVMRLLAWAQEEEGAQYDVIDLLIDLGLITEARFCEDRLQKGDAAWWECANLGYLEGCEGNLGDGMGWRVPEYRDYEFDDAQDGDGQHYQGIAPGGWNDGHGGEYRGGEGWDSDDGKAFELECNAPGAGKTTKTTKNDTSERKAASDASAAVETKPGDASEKKTASGVPAVDMTDTDDAPEKEADGDVEQGESAARASRKSSTSTVRPRISIE